MRALVTGGAGFIGSNLVDALLERGDEVSVVDDLSTGRRENLDARGAPFHEASITDGAAMAALLADERPEAVFHLAAQVDVRRAVADPAFDAAVNVGGTAVLLEAARAAGTRRFVLASTGGAIYGDTDRLPTPEDVPAAPISPYGASKAAAETYLELYRRLHGLSTVRAALRQRLRPAPGPARRGRRDRHLLPRRRHGPAGARVRRRAPDARLRLRRRRRGGAHRRRGAGRRRRLQRRHGASRRPCSSSSSASASSPPSSRSGRARSAAPASTPRAARAALGWAARVALGRGPRAHPLKRTRGRRSAPSTRMPAASVRLRLTCSQLRLILSLLVGHDAVVLARAAVDGVLLAVADEDAVVARAALDAVLAVAAGDVPSSPPLILPVAAGQPVLAVAAACPCRCR